MDLNENVDFMSYPRCRDPEIEAVAGDALYELQNIANGSCSNSDKPIQLGFWISFHSCSRITSMI